MLDDAPWSSVLASLLPTVVRQHKHLNGRFGVGFLVLADTGPPREPGGTRPPITPTDTPQSQCWRPSSPVTVPSTAKHSAVSLSFSRLGPRRWPAPTDGAFVRDLALPLISGAENFVGAGMMSGVFVLSRSTLRRLFSAPAAAGAGKAEARTRGEAPKHNACAASVAPGVPKGRALVPGAGVELPATGSYTKILALL